MCILVNLGSWLQDLLMSEHGVPFLLFLAVEHVVVTLDYVIMPDMLLNTSKGVVTLENDTNLFRWFPKLFHLPTLP